MNINPFPSKTSTKVRKIVSWISELGLLALLALVIVDLLNKNKLQSYYFSIFIVLYITHIIVELHSFTIDYLKNLSTKDNLGGLMISLFNKPIKIFFDLMCYHFKYSIKSNESQERGTPTSNYRQVTYRDTRIFNYLFSRDISGKLVIRNSHEIEKNDIRFVKLNIKLEYIFHDQESRNQYENQKNVFLEQNKARDEYILVEEKKELEFMKELVMVKLNKKSTPFLFGYCWFIIFTFIIPIAEFYKFYIRSYCCYQTFIIKKVISCSVNINNPEFDTIYKVDTPSIVYDVDSNARGHQVEHEVLMGDYLREDDENAINNNNRNRSNYNTFENTLH